MNSLQTLFEKIDSTHTTHNVPPEVTTEVKAQIQNYYGAAISEGLNSAIDDVIKEKEPLLAKVKADLEDAVARNSQLTNEMISVVAAADAKNQTFMGMKSAIDFQERILKSAFEKITTGDIEGATASIKAALPQDEIASEKPAQSKKAKGA